MSKDFIEGKCNSSSLNEAVRQYKQLSYFTQSKIEDDISEGYFEKYVERKYYNNDVFLNFVKNIFKDDNFLSFAKYYRNPNPSSKLINTRIKETLSRVFFSEDSYFNYVINDQYIEKPKELEDDFDKKLFNAVLFRYNDIIVHDLSEPNNPYREFISIENIVSIEMHRSKISKVSYTAMINHNGEDVYGYAYIDSDKYEFYNKEFDLIKTENHDLGFCPATFVVDKDFKNDEVVKESPFSYLRSEMEEYCFLKTLQRMVDANGTLPIAVKLKTKENKESSGDFDASPGEPMGIHQLGSQVSKEARANAGTGQGKGAVLQAGTVIEAPVVEKDDGSIDMAVIKEFITFHYVPVEALNFLDKRVKDVEKEIIISSIGDYTDGGTIQGSKSDTEIKSNDIVSKQDKLRFLSNTLSASRLLSDKVMLSLAYGKENIEADIFYGSDFFLETQDKLYEMFKNAPNSIERKNILIRLSQRRNMFNKEKSNREVILYKLIPYVSDKEFELAVTTLRISDVNFEYNTRFSHWIAMFESFYGNIVIFWDNLGDARESEKIVVINNLIIDLINKNTNFKTINNGKESES
jgi:hypothetical protein